MERCVLFQGRWVCVSVVFVWFNKQLKVFFNPCSRCCCGEEESTTGPVIVFLCGLRWKSVKSCTVDLGYVYLIRFSHFLLQFAKGSLSRVQLLTSIIYKSNVLIHYLLFYIQNSNIYIYIYNKLLTCL